MKIISFTEKYRQDFIDINTDWIVSNFGSLEEHDIEAFKKSVREVNSHCTIVEASAFKEQGIEEVIEAMKLA